MSLQWVFPSITLFLWPFLKSMYYSHCVLLPAWSQWEGYTALLGLVLPIKWEMPWTLLEPFPSPPHLTVKCLPASPLPHSCLESFMRVRFLNKVRTASHEDVWDCSQEAELHSKISQSRKQTVCSEEIPRFCSWHHHQLLRCLSVLFFSFSWDKSNLKHTQTCILSAIMKVVSNVCRCRRHCSIWKVPDSLIFSTY